MTDISPDLPTYTETDDGGLTERIGRAKDLTLPIMKAPRRLGLPWRPAIADEYVDGLEAYNLESEIVASFFSSIEGGRDDVVADFIARGYVSPDTVSSDGETPLLAAIRVNNLPMVSKLVSLGATVDGYGKAKEMTELSEGSLNYRFPKALVDRTPLQYAAQEGKLTMVKVLMEDYGADDSLVAPDGAIALRLAASNGHREIVEYLPIRRGGAWKRWKTAHAKEMEIAKRAFGKIKSFVLFFIWEIPKCLLYHVPKELCKSIRDGSKYAWKNRGRFGRWCKRQAVELPGRVARKVKKVGKEIWDFLKETPRILKGIWKRVIRFIKAIPRALKMILVWIGQGLKAIGKAVLDILVKSVSFLHTVFTAIISFFRSITLKDIKDGLVYVLSGIFISLPKAIYDLIVAFGQMSYEVLKALLGGLGQCLWYIGIGLLWLVTYVPRKTWQIIKAMGRSTRRGYQECMAYLNPKRI